MVNERIMENWEEGGGSVFISNIEENTFKTLSINGYRLIQKVPPLALNILHHHVRKCNISICVIVLAKVESDSLYNCRIKEFHQ